MSNDVGPEQEWELDRKKVEALALKYCLSLPERQKATRSGEMAGRRSGSSVEFQDRKNYIPGDDLRYIDWRGYARNDRLTVKLFREEITPSVDIFVDCSASMSVSAGKSRLRGETAYLLYLLGKKLHASLRLHRVGTRLEQSFDPLDFKNSRDQRMDNPLPMITCSPYARRPGIKIFITDLLFEFDPREITGAFPNADRLLVVQLLSQFEADPSSTGAFRLEDAETATHLDLKLDKRTVDTYLARLRRLMEDVDRRIRVAGGRFVSSSEQVGIEQLCGTMVKLGMLGV